MDLKLKVQEVVEDLCDELKSFTSLDVSNKVKQDGFPTTRHRDIAYLVRVMHVDGIMEEFGYDRTIISVNVNGNMRDAYLYHHSSVAASSYDTRSQVAIPPVGGNAATAPTTNTPSMGSTVVVNSSGSTRHIQTRHHKADGRLEIPVDWVRTLGWTDGQSIYMIYDEDEGAIVAKAFGQLNDGERVLCTTQISGGRLRIPMTAFRDAGFRFHSGCLHRIELKDNNEIVVINSNAAGSSTQTAGSAPPPPLPHSTFTF